MILESKWVIGSTSPHSPCENSPPFVMFEFPRKFLTNWFMLILTHLCLSAVPPPRALKWSFVSRRVFKKNIVPYLNYWSELFTVYLTRLRMITHFTTMPGICVVFYAVCKLLLLKRIPYICIIYSIFLLLKLKFEVMDMQYIPCV